MRVHCRGGAALDRHLASGAAFTLLLLLSSACADSAPNVPASTDGRHGSVPRLVDRAAELGLDFVHFNGMTGSYYFPEVFGSGGALFDFDNDGDLDVFLAQGSILDPDASPAETTFPAAEPPGDRLYRNDLVRRPDGSVEMTFVDVTVKSGLTAASGYGMGAATGDYDNDGWIDLYVTDLHDNRLWHNDGADGEGRVTFSERAAEAGVEERRWSVPAVFFDFDRDGWLDLYVGNYVDWSLGSHTVCSTTAGEEDYCSPRSFRPETDRLFRNRGDGTFEDWSTRSGIGQVAATTLGAIASDLDGDGWIDLYVANDWMDNLLWHNRGSQQDGTRFEEIALMAGAAVNAEGVAEASMGVAAGDLDGDGDLDLFMTHLGRETNTLFRNDGGSPDGGLRFVDASLASQLGMPSWEVTAFGTAFVDLDGDGDLDVATVNGAIRKIERLAREGSPYPLAEPNQVFRNDGTDDAGQARFTEISELVGGRFVELEVSRGLAEGDLDNDGDPDLLLVNNSGPARLFLNETERQGDWLGLRLLTPDGRRDHLGARVELRLDDGSSRWREVRTDGSYLSAHDPRVVFALSGKSVESLHVRWPDGSDEEFAPLEPNRYHALRQGEGRAP